MREREFEPAVIVKRVDTGDPDTTEISDLARAAGYRVAAEITQTRTEDPEYNIGSGKVATLAQTVAAEDAQTVIFDNRLGPYQTYNLGTQLPSETEVVDRFTLILRIFGQRADTRKAQLQVELAQLRYELPRAEAKESLARRDEHPGFMGLGEYDESREQDIKHRISHIRDELDRIATTEQQRREQRRESGFDLVALAGYTNAGKSTLLQRLASDLEVGENASLHPDLDPTAEAKNKLFTTLGTTTRKLDMDRRDVLITDTVGFISDLPHWLVESFKQTLDSVYRADLILLVVDASESVEAIREKLVTCHDTLYERNEAPIVTVLNKIDTLEESDLADKRTALSALAPDPVAVSALDGDGIDNLLERIHSELPQREQERLVLPLTDDSMSLLSWIHDHAHVENVDYTDDQVVIDFEAQPAIVKKTRSRAGDLPTLGSA